MLIDLVNVVTVGTNQNNYENDPQSMDEFDGLNNLTMMVNVTLI
jgi:hypothetical protein